MSPAATTETVSATPATIGLDLSTNNDAHETVKFANTTRDMRPSVWRGMFGLLSVYCAIRHVNLLLYYTVEQSW